MRTTRTLAAVLGALLALAPTITPTIAKAAPLDDSPIFGIRLRIGGRYDDVRMCVATAAGTRGGPAMDISLFADLPLGDRTSVDLNLPFVRPILFAAGFRMLQFEPQATLLFRNELGDRTRLAVGPSVGLSLHYGPDYRSELSGDGRGESFFAWGPMVGGYVGLELQREGGFDLGLGLSPYALPLFGSANGTDKSGKVFGASLDASFRFDR